MFGFLVFRQIFSKWENIFLSKELSFYEFSWISESIQKHIHTPFKKTDKDADQIKSSTKYHISLVLKLKEHFTLAI